MSAPGSYVYCTVAPELTAVARAAIGGARPGWRPAFSRPGLLTFKVDGGVPLTVERPHPLARTWGRSIGPAADAEAARLALGKARVHVGPRAPGEDVAADVAALDALRDALGGQSGPARIPSGARVVDVIAPPGGSDEPLFLGEHAHSAAHSAWPLGLPVAPVPADAPSRAARKMAEGLAISDAPLRAGDGVLEFGCSPGGASFVLLGRGARVLGVDPEPVAPVVAADARFRHLPLAIGAFPRAELPPDTAWLVVDISVAAPVAARSLQRFFPPLRKTLCGLFFTLKINEWGLVDRLPALLDQLRGHGLLDLRVHHLPANRQELFLYGETALGQARRRGSA